MNAPAPIPTRASFPLERVLALMLGLGTWLASATIAAGLAIAAFGGHDAVPIGMRIVGFGIGLFVLLPILRVVVMLGVFVKQRDVMFAAAAAIVLAIVSSGFAAGMLLR